MKTSILIAILFLCITKNANAQKWVDTLYNFQQINDIPYGTNYDFAGNIRTHLLNVTVPVNDTAPACGRPLLLAIHGGAFLAGNKDSDAPPNWIKDFARRGYTCASINYRLGMFHTDSYIHCNVANWDCLNMQDTAEWYRGAYRAMQDAKGALRFLLNNAALYNIDPRNVFLVGESAGGITALQVAFLDDASEKYSQAGVLNNVAAPNALYEGPCILTGGFDTSIASMQLTRPDLGNIDGDLNPSFVPYTIKGVGSFYGAIVSDIFTLHTYTKAPVLYMYHQPNDLVVNYDYGKIEGGVSNCFTQFPTFCQGIVNLPYAYGSYGIRNMINNLSVNGVVVPQVFFDSTLNNADCYAQALNPSMVGHSIDDYNLRTLHMAQFFAPQIDTSSICNTNVLEASGTNTSITVYPNPAETFLYVNISNEKIIVANFYDLLCKKIYTLSNLTTGNKIYLPPLQPGVYLLELQTSVKIYHSKFSKK